MPSCLDSKNLIPLLEDYTYVYSYINWQVIGLGNIERPYVGAWNFQGGIELSNTTAVKI